jgi:capsular exopolysaccharide synthesis family protein
MGKTYEALKHAEREHEADRQAPPPGPTPRRRPRLPKRASDSTTRERYQDLKTNILTRYPDGSIKVILFTGTAHGDGSSTTALNFATTMARDCKLKVLLVDVNFRTPCLQEVFKIDKTPGLSDILTNADKMASSVQKVGPNLYVLTSGGDHSGPVGLFESTQFDQFLKAMRAKFDYVILDAPPAPAFSESRVMCSKVDGVVLVVESGKTRRQVALKVKKQLEEAGGKILGIVLNKQRYYIPDFIYKRL